MMHILLAICKLVPFLPVLMGMPFKTYQQLFKPALGEILTAIPSATYQIVDYVKEITFPEQEARIFNGGITLIPETQGDFLLSYRITLNDYTEHKKTKAGLVELDKSLQVTGLHWLDLTAKSDLYITDPEDPRIFWFKHNLYLLYNAQISTSVQMVLSRMQRIGAGYSIANIQPLNFTKNPGTKEKNWSPFVYQDQLHFIYSANPTLILRYDEKHANLLVESETFYPSNKLSNLWKYGQISGGTPALYIPEWNAYLTFFHSFKNYKYGQPAWEISKEPWWRIYYMGAYIFEAKPPFRILAITEKPLTYPELYNNATANYHIIFPCGFVEDGSDFIISAGIDDIKLALLRVNKLELYNHFTWLNDKVGANG